MDEDTRRRTLDAALSRARTLPLRDDALWRTRPLRVLDVIDGDTLILWTRLERIPPPDADGQMHEVVARALRSGDAIVVALQDARAPKMRQPHGRAAHEVLRRLARRGARVWLVGADRDRHLGRTLPCRTLRVEIAGERVVCVEEALVRCGAAYHYPVSSHSPDVTLALAELEAAAKRERLGVWARGSTACGERPWDYVRRMREQGRRSPSPRSRYVDSMRFGGAAEIQN